MPGGICAVAVFVPGEVVDDAGRGSVPVVEGVLNAGNALQVRSPISAEKSCCGGSFPPKHQRQQVPVHLSVDVWVGVEGDGIGGIGEPSVQTCVAVRRHGRCLGEQVLVALVCTQDVRGERVDIGPCRPNQRKPLLGWDHRREHHRGCRGRCHRSGARARPGVAAQSSASERRAVIVQHLERYDVMPDAARQLITQDADETA